jgi:hypothetical protein
MNISLNLFISELSYFLISNVKFNLHNSFFSKRENPEGFFEALRTADPIKLGSDGSVNEDELIKVRNEYFKSLNDARKKVN